MQNNYIFLLSCFYAIAHNYCDIENMGISDVGDRVKILQQITTMSADLITSSPYPPTKRVHPSWRQRRHSDMTVPRFRSQSQLPVPRFRSQSQLPVRHYNSSASLHQKSQLPVKYATLDRPLKYRRASAFELLSGSRNLESSRVNSPVKASASSSQESQLHYIMETDEDVSRSVQATATLRNHKKRLSRSVNGLLQVHIYIYVHSQCCIISLLSPAFNVINIYFHIIVLNEDEDFSPTTGLHRHSSEGSRLVQVLREENTTLKRELETYYQRVRRLQKVTIRSYCTAWHGISIRLV